ncbi:MAG: DUF2085 domain-containing protein [Candidatus Aminicenantes bacterium]|nr:MAG: DUF2085 domain-containing protein [Candidatus Aminicenantes bacterium]
MKKKNKILLIYLLTASGIVAWLCIIFLAPYLKSRSFGLNTYIYSLCSPFCHQIPSRSFVIFHHPLAVCARCLGIYFGFLAGVVFYPFVRGFSEISLPKLKTFFFISLPIVIDTLGNLFLWATPGWIRLLLGVIWGFILPFYFIAGLADYFVNIKKLRSKNKS